MQKCGDICSAKTHGPSTALQTSINMKMGLKNQLKINTVTQLTSPLTHNKTIVVTASQLDPTKRIRKTREEISQTIVGIAPSH